MKAKAGTCGGWLSLDEGVEDRAEEGRGTEGCETWIRDEAFLDAQSCPGRAIVLEQVRTVQVHVLCTWLPCTHGHFREWGGIKTQTAS